MAEQRSQLLLVVLEFVALSTVSWLLIKYYKSDNVTVDVAISVYLSWVLGFAGVLLLPYDMSTTVLASKETILTDVWDFIYWSTFVLAWVVLPVQLEYHSSGHFSFREKLHDALRKNIYALVIAATAGVVYIMYNVVTGNGSPYQVINFMMAMGNTYGVFIIIVLMGSGLVGLPRRLWQLADSEKELSRLYMSAVSIDGAYQDARYELEDCEADVLKVIEKAESASMGSRHNLELMRCAGVLKERLDSLHSGLPKDAGGGKQSKFSRAVTSSIVLSGEVDKKTFVDLHARLIKCHTKSLACERRWKVLLYKSGRYEKIVQNGRNGDTALLLEDDWSDMDTEVSAGLTSAGPATKVGSATAKIKPSRYFRDFFLAVTRRLLTITVYKSGCKALSLLCGLASAVILWSELLMATALESPIAFLMGARNMTEQTSGALVQVISFLVLSYMSVCTYWSLFRINLGWAYTLQGPQQSPPSSLIFNGQYFSRLQFSLGYNFLLILNVTWTTRTAFSRLMNNIQIVPVFGTSFTTYVPMVMVMVALLTFFNTLSRVLHMIGVDSDETTNSAAPRCCSFRKEDHALSAEEQEKVDLGKRLIGLGAKQAALSRQLQRGERSVSVGSNPVLKEASSSFNPLNSMGLSARYGKVDLESNDNDNGRIDDDDDDDDNDRIYSRYSNSIAMGGLQKSNSANWKFDGDEEEEQTYGGRYS